MIIADGTIDGTSTGIRAGEPGQNIAGPAVQVTDVGITDAVHNTAHGDIDNVTQSPMTVNLDDDGNTLVAHAGATGSFVINGGDGADVVTTGAGADTLNGGAGNDTLDGGAGVDAMNGGAGNDTYVVDNAGDVVTEASGAGSGTDTVQSSVSFTLGANVENLTLTGGGNINGTGNGDANVITGNAGNNIHHRWRRQRHSRRQRWYRYGHLYRHADRGQHHDRRRYRCADRRQPAGLAGGRVGWTRHRRSHRRREGHRRHRPQLPAGR